MILTRDGRKNLEVAIERMSLTWDESTSPGCKAAWQAFENSLKNGEGISIQESADNAPMVPEAKEAMSILQEAQQIVHGARMTNYGHPLDNWSATAKIWSGILAKKLGDKEILPEEACLCMIGVKVAREVFRPRPDNLVDIAGYAAVIELIINERDSRLFDQGG